MTRLIALVELRVELRGLEPLTPHCQGESDCSGPFRCVYRVAICTGRWAILMLMRPACVSGSSRVLRTSLGHDEQGKEPWRRAVTDVGHTSDSLAGVK
jgi:hypothetical protein